MCENGLAGEVVFGEEGGVGSVDACACFAHVRQGQLCIGEGQTI